MTEPQPKAPETPSKSPSAPYRPDPILLIFLLMPILAGITAILISGGGQTPSSATTEPPAVGFTPFSLIGVTAPDFELPTPNGSEINLASYRGGWVVINFWATWCGPCRAEMPLLQDLSEAKFDAAARIPGGVKVIAVNRAESGETVTAFLQELNLSLSVALDSTAKVTNAYGGVQLPLTYFVNPDGIVSYRHIGALTPDLINRYLEKMGGESD